MKSAAAGSGSRSGGTPIRRSRGPAVVDSGIVRRVRCFARPKTGPSTVACSSTVASADVLADPAQLASLGTQSQSLRPDFVE